MKVDYQSAGVDIDLGDRFASMIGRMAKPTLNRRVRASVGGYASLYEASPSQWIAASTDGVGTKLKLAIQSGNHRTVGIDLVAMSVNDLLCVGARPLFFLDYYATSKLDLETGAQVMEGIVAGCKQAGCALVGGETAEMPDFYAPGDYDLAGFAVGTVAPKRVLPSRGIRAGDALIGLASSGLHSNGFSLVRQWLDQLPEGERKLRSGQCLEPTRIYAKALMPLLDAGLIQAASHITGSGFLNLPRVSEKFDYEVRLPEWEARPEVFAWVRDASGLSLEKLATTFNLGIGMVLVVSPKKAPTVKHALKKSKQAFWEIGRVVRRPGKNGGTPTVWIHDPSLGQATLKY